MRASDELHRGENVTRRIRAGLVAALAWIVGLMLVGAAATVCSSCGGEVSAAPAQCTPAGKTH
jgi:hypothetical protein